MTCHRIEVDVCAICCIIHRGTKNQSEFDGVPRRLQDALVMFSLYRYVHSVLVFSKVIEFVFGETWEKIMNTWHIRNCAGWEFSMACGLAWHSRRTLFRGERETFFSASQKKARLVSGCKTVEKKQPLLISGIMTTLLLEPTRISWDVAKLFVFMPP